MALIPAPFARSGFGIPVRPSEHPSRPPQIRSLDPPRRASHPARPDFRAMRQRADSSVQLSASGRPLIVTPGISKS
jgi:hypothetical protein